MEDLLLQYIKI